MNIEINNKEKGRRHISFQKMLVMIVVCISICVQVVFVGYIGYKTHTFSNDIIDANLKIEHQNLLDNVAVTNRQVEDLLSFITSNQFTHYMSLNLNLRDELYAENIMETIALQCEKSEIRADIVKGFALIGRNRNQKTLVYDFVKEELSEYQGIEMSMLEECGLLEELYQTLNVPLRLEKERLEDIEERYGKNRAESSTLAQLIDKCEEHYVVSDIINDVQVLVFVDKDAFSEGLEQQGDYGSLLIAENGEMVLVDGQIAERTLEHLNMEEQKLTLDMHGYHIEKTEIQPEDLWAISICKNGENFIRVQVVLRLVALLIVFNIMAFLLAHIFSKRLVRFGTQFTVSLFISCLIPFLFLNIFCNRIIGKCGEILLEQYASNCVNYYENVVSEFQTACEQITTEHAIDMIYSLEDGRGKEENVELVRQFEEKMLAQRAALSDYSYAIVLGTEYDVLHQSIYSGRVELFRNIVNRAAANGAKNPQSTYYYMEANPVAEDYVLILQIPVIDDNKVIGTILIALEGTTIDSLVTVMKGKGELLWVYGKKSIYGEEHLKEIVGTQALRQIATRQVSDGKRYDDYLVKVCKQDMLADTKMLLAIDVQEYTSVLNSVMEDSLLMWLILTILIILISIFVMSLVLRPIIEMTKKFSANKGKVQTLEINTGVTEINNLIRVYNDMVERQKVLQENEKRLITLRTQAEFKMLQQQVNPHFMFNTLEVVNLLADGDNSKEISDIVQALAEILRFSLKGEETVTAGEEVAALRKYLLIQNMRFEDYITFEIEFDEALSRYSILKFILQPLVENAISHGLADKLEDGEVLVRIKEQGDKLIFSVQDNGVGMTEEDMKELLKKIYDDSEEYGYTKGGIGIGLKNIYRRLQYYYGEEAELQIESIHNVGTKVVLSLPKKMQM